ncbi:MAG: hypothetical protein ACI8T1_001667 [Verrucomicrobiales bacterium]|jgi:hypothetical protein
MADSTKKIFLAYPDSVREVRDAIQAAVELGAKTAPSLKLHPWTANDIAGKCLVDPILAEISGSAFLMADITKLNFNVVYEIGFAIGKGKRAVLTLHRAVENDALLARNTGIFDTLGYMQYNDAESYLGLIDLAEKKPLVAIRNNINRRSPVYVVFPDEKTEAETRLTSRLKEARITYRQFDPTEESRLTVHQAIQHVSESHGVILPLVPSSRKESKPHNLRCAFIAGVAHALEREVLMVQSGFDPVPLDYRDFVSSYGKPDEIDSKINRFAPKITELLQIERQQEFPETQSDLQNLFVGESSAENEYSDLQEYYVQVDEFNRVLNGNVQIIAGRKGSGKTAMFYQLTERLARDKRRVVVALKPESFQLRKFKSLISKNFEEGTQDHTITAFWDYLLLLEICHELLEKDRGRRIYDPQMRDLYSALSAAYGKDESAFEGDFAERLLHLVESIEDAFGCAEDSQDSNMLTRKDITDLIYKRLSVRLAGPESANPEEIRISQSPLRY